MPILRVNDDIQAVIDQLSSTATCGTVQLGPGTYVLTAGLVLPAGIELKGAGMSATRLSVAGNAALKNTDVITVTGNDCKISDMTIYGFGGGLTACTDGSTQAGIRVAGPALAGDNSSSESVINGLVVERVVIAQTLTRGISLGTTAGSTAPTRSTNGLSVGHTLVIASTVRDCRFANIRGGTGEPELYVAPGSTTVLVEGVYFQILAGPGVGMTESRGVTFLNCTFEDAGIIAYPFVYLGGQNFNITLEGCYFEKHGGNGTAPFVYCYHRNHGITLRDCHFVRPTTDASSGTVNGYTITGDQFVGVLGTAGAAGTNALLGLYQTTKALISGCTAYTQNAAPKNETSVLVNPDSDATLDFVVIENSWCSSLNIINNCIAFETATLPMSGSVTSGFTRNTHIKTTTLANLA